MAGVQPFQSRLARAASSRWAAAGFLPVLALFAALAAFGPPELGPLLFSSPPALGLAGALAACLAAFAARRLETGARLQAVGSALLHFSLALLLAGALWNWKGAQRSPVVLAEGQRLDLPGSGATLTLDRFHPAWMRDGRLVGPAALMRLESPGGLSGPHTLGLNRPLKHGAWTLVLGEHGFLPLVKVRSLRSQRDFESYIHLDTVLKPETDYRGVFGLPALGLQAFARLRPAAEGHVLRSPSLRLRLRGPSGRAAYDGEVFLGHPDERGGLRVELKEVRYWVSFILKQDPGLGLIFTAFWLAVAGASAALLPRVLRHAP